MTYDPQTKKIIIASSGMHIYSVDLQNNKIQNDEIKINLSGHGVAYDLTKNKIITYNGYYIYCYEPNDFYSGNKDKSEKKIYQKKPNSSSQGLGAYGGLVFLIFSNKDSNGNYYSNTIVVYDIENDKVVDSLESDYSHEFEDCMFDSSGDLYISDTMGNVFKPGVNAYTLGANGSVSAPTSGTTPNFKKTIFDYLMEFVTFSSNILSDACQALCETCENNKSFINSLKLTRSISEIEADPVLKEKINLKSALSMGTSTTSTNEETKTLKETTIPSTIDDKLGNQQTVLGLNTPIPIMEMSFENYMIDNISILDIDFFNKANTNSNSEWIAYRKIVNIISHGIIYICAAALLVMLIVRSIILVISSIRGLTNQARRSREIMDNLLGAIAIIVGIFVVMAVITYLNKLLINITIGENRNNFLIKINVDNICSFNSNFMGYLKYRTLSTDMMDAAKWSLLRLGFSLINILFLIAMIARMVIIGFLTMIAPITAVTFMLNREVQNEESVQSILYFRPFISLYTRLVLFQAICAICLMIVLKI